MPEEAQQEKSGIGCPIVMQLLIGGFSVWCCRNIWRARDHALRR
jgi:hypothetical protein